MIEIEVKITDNIGFHARTASIFAKKAAAFESNIIVKANDKIVNGKSMLNLMSLGVKSGMNIFIMAEGQDSDEAINVLRQLVENNFEIIQ